MTSYEEREANRLKQARYRKTQGQPSKAMQVRQDALCSLVTDHPEMTLAQACAEIGIRRNTEEQWRVRYPSYKQRITYIMARRRGEIEPPSRQYGPEFVQEFFGFDTPEHLGQIRAGIQQVQAEAVRDKEPKAILILAPPDHAKSTEVENYITFRIADDPNVRCLLLSKTLAAARKRTGRIQRRLTDRAMFPEFIDTYGPFKSESREDSRPWRSDYFTVIGQNSGERDHTLEALGIQGQIYGARAEIIVLDDIADLQNQTPAEVEKQLEYIQVEVTSRLVETGILIVIGTHMRERDVYTRLEELGLFDKVIKLPALTYDEEGKAKALWPKRYPVSRLEKLQTKRDRRIWELVWMQNPLPSVGSVFTQDAIESCYDPDRYIGHIPEGSIVVAGVDPSVINFTAGVVIALKRLNSGEWMRYLVDVWNEKGLTGEGGDNQAGVVEFIVELCRKYHVNTLCVEDGAWMSYLNNSFTMRSQLGALGVNHVPRKVNEQTTGEHAIAQMSGLFNHRLISIPGSPGSIEHLQPMMNQFITWTGEKQHWRKAFDIIKAFRMADEATKIVTRRTSSNVIEVDFMPARVRSAR